MNKNLTWNTHGRYYIKVWSSKLLAILWLGNIINAIYVHFWLPRFKKEILWNLIPEKYRKQWCSVGQSRTKLWVFLSYQKGGKLNFECCWRSFQLAHLEVFKTFDYSKLCEWEIESCLSKKNSKKNGKIIGWPYNVPLKSFSGHTKLWLADFPYHDHRKKKRKLMALP